VTVDELLDAAAASVTCMPDAVTAQRLEELEAERRRRSGIACARHRAELESLDLDLAAYQLARQYDDSGHLDAAARWYKMAAANDFADAPLRLGRVLEMLAQRVASAGSGYYTSRREELALVSEAARWYAEAYGAGHPEAAERLDGMISNHDARRPRATEPTPAADPVPAPDPQADICGQGGLDKVVNGSDLVTASAHFRQCTACQREFLRRGGVLPQMRGHSQSAQPTARPR
jgi:hypothetical protein